DLLPANLGSGKGRIKHAQVALVLARVAGVELGIKRIFVGQGGGRAEVLERGVMGAVAGDVGVGQVGHRVDVIDAAGEAALEPRPRHALLRGQLAEVGDVLRGNVRRV